MQTAFGRVDGVYAADPVRTILHDLLVEPGGARIVPFRLPFFWAVTNLSDLCGNYYYHAPAEPRVADATAVSAAFRRKGARLKTIAPDQPAAFVEALRASSALPAFFQPAYIGGDVFVDGGVVNNTPFDVAKIARRLFAPGRPLEIHSVFNAPVERHIPPAQVRNGLAILFACYDLMQKRLVDDAARLTVREAALVKRMSAADVEADEHLRDARDVSISVIRPNGELAGTLAGFDDQQAIDANFDRGVHDGRRGWRPYAVPGEFCGAGT